MKAPKLPKPKVIKYGYTEEDAVLFDGLIPAKKHIPDWYKKTPVFHGDGKPHVRGHGGSSPTIKACAPFLDSMLTGYVVELWMDVEISKTRGMTGMGKEEPQIHWPAMPIPIQERSPAIAEHLPIPTGHYDKHYIWESPIIIEVPKGYSLLITHPLNRSDLPFTTLSAVVDADTNPMGAGAIPFFLKKDFEGIIPRGTPIFQVIPFKREAWVAEKDDSLISRGKRVTVLAIAYAHAFYKRFSWTKKEFN